MARVLIIDDNLIMAEILSVILECHGHETLVAYGGLEALDIITANHLDIVLLDMMMHSIEGFETLRRLRAIPWRRDLPVIVISTREENGLEEKVISAGGDGFLQKPVDGRTLADIIAAYTNRSHQINEGDGFALQSCDSSLSELVRRI